MCYLKTGSLEQWFLGLDFKYIQMKRFTVFILFILIGCTYSELDYEMSNFDKKLSSKRSGSSGGACPVGRWSTPTCNGNGKLIYVFRADGTGYSSNPECSGLCTPLIFNFTYRISGNSIIYSFTTAEDVTCGGQVHKPTPPSGQTSYSITFKCENGGQRLVTETSNVNTGQRSTTIFLRE